MDVMVSALTELTGTQPNYLQSVKVNIYDSLNSNENSPDNRQKQSKQKTFNNQGDNKSQNHTSQLSIKPIS
jgi:hypothetical protein